MSNTFQQENASPVDSVRAEQLLRNILKLEEMNNKTGTLTDQEMVRRIVKMIEEAADCYSNPSK